MSIVSEGDEVVTFEPFWPGCVNIIHSAGGKLIGVPMSMTKNSEQKTISWDYDWEAFEEAMNDNTKLLMLINPHSPSGRVFTQEDIEKITEILDKKAPK